MNTGAIPSNVPGGIRLREAAAGAPLDTEALRTASPERQRKAVAGQFEAILVRQLLGKTMDSMFDSTGGAVGSIYGGMLADTLAQQLTAGPGLGLGRYLEHQLEPHGLAPGATPPSEPHA